MRAHPQVHWPPGWGPDRCDSFLRHERRVAAPAGAVFTHLAAIADWPTWQRGVECLEACDDLVVGGRFVIRTAPHTFDGIVGEFAPPRRFGWMAVGDGLTFYQSWLLLDEPGGATRAVFHEAARGPSALLRAVERSELTRGWVDALPPVAAPVI